MKGLGRASIRSNGLKIPKPKSFVMRHLAIPEKIEEPKRRSHKKRMVHFLYETQLCLGISCRMDMFTRQHTKSLLVFPNQSIANTLISKTCFLVASAYLKL
ncbi:hypothetical protein E2C01_029091 [Portunus trituberculatus]|uniref:Uncharacterized protein n=1 Tax=Portunus trituberculatus TaxID=210409 RepID=A0A5B7ERW8_PORTR|nr:hypothetical protein [Portunus trituberculatus]